jgi:hypothetical protein
MLGLEPPIRAAVVVSGNVGARSLWWYRISGLSDFQKNGTGGGDGIYGEVFVK